MLDAFPAPYWCASRSDAMMVAAGFNPRFGLRPSRSDAMKVAAGFNPRYADRAVLACVA
jgi:hypothetical protein